VELTQGIVLDIVMVLGTQVTQMTCLPPLPPLWLSVMVLQGTLEEVVWE
jgi:hypothetical protein